MVQKRRLVLWLKRLLSVCVCADTLFFVHFIFCCHLYVNLKEYIFAQKNHELCSSFGAQIFLPLCFVFLNLNSQKQVEMDCGEKKM